jgi:hypothetical protein
MMGAFLGFALVAHMGMGKFLYSSWPFDGLCKNDEYSTAGDGVLDSATTAMSGGTANSPGTVYSAAANGTHTAEYQKCNTIQRAFTLELVFESKGPQTILTSFYQWVLIVAVVCGFIYSVAFRSGGFIRRLFHAELRDMSKASDDQFSEQRSIKLYVPEFQYAAQVNPLLACDMSKVETRYISWVGNFEEYNLYEYAKKHAEQGDLEVPLDMTKVFSACKQYVKYNDRLAHFAIRIQRAQRAKNKYRKSIKDRMALDKEAEEEAEQQALRDKAAQDMARIEMTIRQIHETQTNATGADATETDARLKEMNEKLEKLRALDDLPQKLQQLDALEGMDGKLQDMHVKLGNLQHLDKLDDMHNKIKDMDGLGAFAQQEQLGKIGQLEGKLEEVNAKLSQLHSAHGDEIEKMGTAFATSSDQLETRLAAHSKAHIGAINAQMAASREEQHQLLQAVASLHKENASLNAESEIRDAELVAAKAKLLAAELFADGNRESLAGDSSTSRSLTPEPPRKLAPKTQAPVRRKSRKVKTAAPTTTAPNPERHYCTFWEGPFQGEQQEIEIGHDGFNMHSSKGETQVKWLDIQKWRVGEENRFEFDTAKARFPCIFDTMEQTLAMLEVFQNRCTMQLRCFQLMDECDGGEDEEGDVSVRANKINGVSIDGNADIPWGAIQQWSLEPGEEEPDGSVSMDMFEFWACDRLGREKEYAFECDSIDALYLQASFEQHAQPKVGGSLTGQRQRVIV